MAKEKSIEASITIEGMAEGFRQFIDFCREMADADKKKMKDEAKEDIWAEEKELVREQFNRVVECMKKAKPGTDEYYQLSRDLYQLKNIVDFWH